jgi:hypothetical protein
MCRVVGIEGRPDVHGRELKERYIVVEVQLVQAAVEVDEYSVRTRKEGSENEKEKGGR